MPLLPFGMQCAVLVDNCATYSPNTCTCTGCDSGFKLEGTTCTAVSDNRRVALQRGASAAGASNAVHSSHNSHNSPLLPAPTLAAVHCHPQLRHL